MLTALYNSPPSVNPIPALSPAAWFRGGYGVTGTLTASNWADQSGNGRDLAQGTAGNQPIYLPYSGTPYAYLPGVASNYFSTPDSVALQTITTAFDVDAYVSYDDWTTGAYQFAVAKDQTSKRSLSFGLSDLNQLYCDVRDAAGGGVGFRSSANPSVSDGAALWIRAKVNWPLAGTCTCDFYTSADGVTWSALGVQQTNAATGSAIGSFDNPLLVGDREISSLPSKGKIYRARLYSSDRDSGGTLLIDFNPSTFSETSTNGATATASTGEVWTLNSTGAKPAQIVKSASLLGDGTNHWMATATFTNAQPQTVYMVAKQISWTSNSYIFDGNSLASMVMSQQSVSPKVRIDSGGGSSNLEANWTVGSYAVVASMFNGSGSLIQVNANTATTGASVGAGTAGGLYLFTGPGAGTFFNGQFKEFILFNAAHTAAERSLVRNWLNYVHHCY